MKALGLTVGLLLLLSTASWAQVDYEIYQVRPGDTVHNIAARFGVVPERVQRVSGAAARGELAPGESLVILLGARPAARKAEESEFSREITPRFAIVTSGASITSEPGDGRVYYDVVAGSRVIVTSENLSYWGVVMADGSTGWLPKSAAELTGELVDPQQIEAMLKGGRPDVVAEALRFLGTPYRYGGSLPDSVDCSLLVQVAFAARGIRLPRTAAEQFEVGLPVTYSQLVPGDRVYFIDSSGRINHTGIYIGSGQFVHASSRRRCVAVDSLTSPLYWSRFVGARRS